MRVWRFCRSARPERGGSWADAFRIGGLEKLSASRSRGSRGKISQEPHPRTSKGCGTTSNPVQVRERVRRPPMRRYDWIFRRFLVRFERRRCRSNEEYFVRGSFQRTPLPMKNGRKSSRSFTDGSDFLRTIAPYQQVTSSDASFLGSCAVGVPPSFCASEITSLT